MLGFPREDVPTPSWDRRRDGPVFARNGLVAAGHPLVAQAGLDTLRRGGNAVDAAVTAGLVGAVVMPEMCGLGGDLFALVHTPADDAPGTVTSIEACGAAPRGATLEGMRAAGDGASMPARGPLSITVPGMVDGYATLLERFGTRRFADVVGPAIEHAEGHPISVERVGFFRSWTELLRRDPRAAAVFLPDGEPPRPGSMLRQPDLARTLTTMAAEGPDGFYSGAIADRMATYLAERGGALTAADLDAHRTTVSEPLSTTYRGYPIYQTALPSQGLILLEALNVAERFDLAGAGVGSAEAIHVLVEAIKLAFADRHAYCRDPAAGDFPVKSSVERLVSAPWARRRAGEIASRASTRVPPGRFDDGDTSYLCVVDGDGTMVSLIQSVAANFGSGIVGGDTGVVLNNRAQGFSLDEASPNVFAPGKRPMHTLNCYLVADPSGRPVAVGGTPGGDRQPQWNLQVLTGLIDAGWDAQQTIDQPRWISTPTAPDAGAYRLTVERRIGQAAADDLTARGHEVELGADWGLDSVAQLIARDPETGVLCGGTDPRSEGQVLGF